ncbi:MAG TPA: hypothetical protein VMH87_00425 [Pseudomonadales bacterium]|nr:hypothetical protein [Pseudomonadales bacterium]
MKLTDRDKQLVVWLPTLAVIIGYSWLLASAPHKRIKQLKQQISQAIEKAPRPLDLAEYQAKIAQANRDLAASEAETAKMKADLAAFAGVSTNATHANTAEQIAALFSRHHLTLVEQIPVSIEPGTLSPALQRVVDQSSKTLGANSAVFWQVKLSGNYLDMAAALNDLGNSDLRSILASLNMTDGEQPGTKLWTLVLWM